MIMAAKAELTAAAIAVNIQDSAKYAKVERPRFGMSGKCLSVTRQDNQLCTRLACLHRRKCSCAERRLAYTPPSSSRKVAWLVRAALLPST